MPYENIIACQLSAKLLYMQFASGFNNLYNRDMN